MKWIGITRCGDMAIQIFQNGGRPPSWIWSNRKHGYSIRRPRKPYLEQKIKWIGWPVVGILLFEIRHITRGAFGTPILREGEVVEGQRSYNLEERWWFPIRSSLWPLRYLCWLAWYLSVVLLPRPAGPLIRYRGQWMAAYRAAVPLAHANQLPLPRL